jgi:uncharacterized protein
MSKSKGRELRTASGEPGASSLDGKSSAVGQPVSAGKASHAGRPGHMHPRPLKLRIHTWLHRLHTYISMFSLLLILFFAVTGITLNHPDWTLGSTEKRQQLTGTLPADSKKGSEVNWLKVAEYLRAQHGVHGHADDPRLEGGEGSISFKAPDYSAGCFIQEKTGHYELNVETRGALALLNDLHRGQDAGTLWMRTIDLSGIFLTVLSLTGIGLLLYLKRIRRAALITMVVGIMVTVILMKLTE